ncbi:MAG TPA: hypothetical protein ENI69_00360 [Rhodospirillales bacterium]|nr:hypothetical protein [Rhodospirillales bacterium]
MQDQPKNDGMERRMVHRLLMHWRSAQQGEGIPDLKDVLSRDLGDIHPCIYVLEIDDELADPFFQRIGLAFADEGNNLLVGQPLSEAPENTLLCHAAKYFSRVQVKQIPITLGGEFEHTNGDTILYRSIIMPTCDDDGAMRFLIGAANCKSKDA